jgi:hypothetical protein
VNNALTAVICSLELVLRHTEAGSAAQEHLRSGLVCAEQAADTVRRIVSFTGRAEAPGVLAPLSLGQVARAAAARLRG